MGRLVGIDYGTKRVGVAATDPLQIVASPLDVIHSSEIIDFLKKYAQNEEVEKFIVGWPTQDDGTATNNTPHVVGFIRILEKTFPNIPVIKEDESYTSKMAIQAMIAGGMKKKDRQKKGNVDKISATIILQSYMESTQFNR